MKRNPVNKIILEGPDLSGKTTLYEMIHKKTGYQWNIQDRSALSMLVHAKYYGRDEFHHIESVKEEIYNLNNFIIMLLPSWNTIAQRFNKRGDPIQDIISLRKIYDLFKEVVEEFENYPNVMTVRCEISDWVLNTIVDSLYEFENADLKVFQEQAMNYCLTKNVTERIGLNFTHYDDGTFTDVNKLDIEYESEKDYYQKIEQKLRAKMSDNFCDYQDKTSRRIIYADDSCISLAHFLIRDKCLDCKFFIRSSNTRDTLYYDLNFLKYLTQMVYDIFELKGYFCKMQFTINSAHIPSKID
jgi:hypothetical protein